MSIEIKSFRLEDDAVIFEWAELPDAVRVDGAVVVTHVTVASPEHPSIRDDVDELRDRLRALLADIQDTWENSEPFQPPPPEHEHEEMGW